MFRVVIFNHQAELNDAFLAPMVALGADCPVKLVNCPARYYDTGALVRLGREIPVMLEHLPDEATYDPAAAHVRQAALQEGLSI